MHLVDDRHVRLMGLSDGELRIARHLPRPRTAILGRCHPDFDMRLSSVCLFISTACQDIDSHMYPVLFVMTIRHGD